MKRKKKYFGDKPDAPWTKFERATHFRTPDGNSLEIPDDEPVLINNHYQVMLRGFESRPPWGRVLWLSIKRLDRQAIRDWRDLQRIKNEVTSPDLEAVEIFPAESRLVDSSNQYHLWVFVDGFQFPYGYAERMVTPAFTDSVNPVVNHAVQRPWRSHEQPEYTVKNGKEWDEKHGADPLIGTRLIVPESDPSATKEMHADAREDAVREGLGPSDQQAQPGERVEHP
jgi:hypothetical protein